jgi:hypothetical protein
MHACESTGEPDTRGTPTCATCTPIACVCETDVFETIKSSSHRPTHTTHNTPTPHTQPTRHMHACPRTSTQCSQAHRLWPRVAGLAVNLRRERRQRRTARALKQQRELCEQCNSRPPAEVPTFPPYQLALRNFFSGFLSRKEKRSTRANKSNEATTTICVCTVDPRHLHQSQQRRPSALTHFRVLDHKKMKVF